MITGENKVWVDLRRTLLYAFVKKICELYFCKEIFTKNSSFWFCSNESLMSNLREAIN